MKPSLHLLILVFLFAGLPGWTQEGLGNPASQQVLGGHRPNVPAPAPDFRKLVDKAIAGSGHGAVPAGAKAISYYLEAVTPDQGGVVWIAFLVSLMVAADFTRLWSRRTLDLSLLLVPIFLFVDITRFGLPGAISDSGKFFFAGIVFTGVFLATAAVTIRSVIGSRQPGQPWTPNLKSSVLAALLFVLLVSNTLVAINTKPNDCGVFTSIGAARMLETGKFPYGDPKLRDGAAATYGPMLYLAHIPFQALLSAVGLETAHNDQTGVPEPPLLATKLVALSMHFLLIACLVILGKRLGGPAIGYGLACLYAGSAHVQGLGGAAHFINGMSYVSHIVPAALTLAALALTGRPFLAGATLASAAGAIFFPAFFFPVFLGHYFWKGGWKGGEWRRFTTGFVLVCALIGGAVLLLTETQGKETALQAVYKSTVAHQESKEAYGSSAFSFWGTHPRLAAFWQEPFVSRWHLFKPSFLLFSVFLIATFFLANGRSLPQLAFLIASIASGIQLWKSHAGGTYVEWYLPFLLIGMFAYGPAGLEPHPVLRPGAADAARERVVV